MINSPRYGLAALTLAFATMGLLYACDSDDDPGPVGQGAGIQGGGGTGAGTQGGGGTGAGTQGGGGTGAGGQGGQGGALSSTQTCMDACEAMVACGGGGGGGGTGGGPTLEACVDPCNESLEACSSSELHEIMDCLTPHIDPNCDDAAFMACVNAVGCAG